MYLPTHKHGTDMKEDPIRFKNLLRGCEKRLQDGGLSPHATDEILRPAVDMLDSPHVWQHMDRGLAVFITRDSFHAFALPVECPTVLRIGRHFYITPLSPLWGSEHRFHVLALSRGRAHLYTANRHAFDRIKLAQTPENLDEFLRYDEAQESLQHHTMPPGKAAGTAAVFHGQGNIADKAAQKTRVDEYVKAVRNGVERYLGADNCPLILVAPEYIQSAYREVSRYSHLLPEGIQRTGDPLSDDELHDAGRALVEPHFRQVVNNHLDRFRRLLGTGNASDQIELIVSAAQEGRVQTLLLDPTNPLTDESSAPLQNEEEPLDVAIRNTLMQGGEVYVVDHQELTPRSGVGAIFRY